MAKLDFDGLSYFWSKGKTYISNLLKGKADSSHTHDDRYYTESEIDIKLNSSGCFGNWIDFYYSTSYLKKWLVRYFTSLSSIMKMRCYKTLLILTYIFT